MEQDRKLKLEISGPSHLLEVATKDLPPKYIRDRIMLVREIEQDDTTGIIKECWYIQEFAAPEGEQE